MTGTRELVGIGVSPGTAIGPAVVIRRDLPDVPHRVVPADQVEAEVARLHEAVDSVRRALEELRERTLERVGPEEARIFDAQVLMLEDLDFLREVEQLIRDNQLTAERAFEFKALEVRALWKNSANSRLRERIADLSGVQLRVLNHLLGLPGDDPARLTHGRPAILFTRELTPGLTVHFDRGQVVGFVSEEGTRTSHAAILARSLGIPCVMGLAGCLDRVHTGDEVAIDGTRGTVLLGPNAEEVAGARSRESRRRALWKELEEGVGEPAVTVDGVRIALRGNLDLPEELPQLAEHGAEGVGLLRTEFLVVGRADLPDEEEQVEYFRRVVRRLKGHPVVVRSYDVGGDKFPAPFRIGPEANPFLGWRAIRVCLDQPELFLPQLRALLRARVDGDVRLMLPLVTDVGEVEAVRDLVRRAAASLATDRIAAADDLPVGVMVETPAAALIVDHLAELCDFLSVGTNDLTQYTLAVDRGNARLADRFTAMHPAVIGLLRDLSGAARRHDLPISVCGELASEPMGAFLLLGLGYRELSVSPVLLPLVRWLVRQVSLASAEAAARDALGARSVAAVTERLETHLARHVDPRTLDAGWLPHDSAQTTLK